MQPHLHPMEAHCTALESSQAVSPSGNLGNGSSDDQTNDDGVGLGAFVVRSAKGVIVKTGPSKASSDSGERLPFGTAVGMRRLLRTKSGTTRGQLDSVAGDGGWVTVTTKSGKSLLAATETGLVEDCSRSQTTAPLSMLEAAQRRLAFGCHLLMVHCPSVALDTDVTMCVGTLVVGQVQSTLDWCRENLPLFSPWESAAGDVEIFGLAYRDLSDRHITGRQAITADEFFAVLHHAVSIALPRPSPASVHGRCRRCEVAMQQASRSRAGQSAQCDCVGMCPKHLRSYEEAIRTWRGKKRLMRAHADCIQELQERLTDASFYARWQVRVFIPMCSNPIDV